MAILFHSGLTPSGLSSFSQSRFTSRLSRCCAKTRKMPLMQCGKG